MIAAKEMGKVKSKRRASGKTVKRKGAKRSKREEKLWPTTKEPNTQCTERDQKQNVAADTNLLGFQVLCMIVFQFQLNREMSFIDMLANSLLEIWILVWTTASFGKPPGFVIHIIVPGLKKCFLLLFLQPGSLTGSSLSTTFNANIICKCL